MDKTSLGFHFTPMKVDKMRKDNKCSVDKENGDHLFIASESTNWKLKIVESV